jgi:methanogenic corrinoid protein MtbC1
VQPADHDRRFTIGEAVGILTAEFPDVSRSSLRFLEDEGLVAPHRTPGGHRLYTGDDLARIRLIKRWQAARHSLAEIRVRLGRIPTDAGPNAIADRFLELALAGHLGRARQAVLEGDELGMSLARIFDEVLRPALVEIGERWAAGSLTVAQEHVLSELVRDIVAQLTLRHLPGETGPAAIVAACVAGEDHDLGLRMVCGMLRERGIDVHFLGADVEHRFIVEAVQRLAPVAVLLSVSLDEHLPALDEALQALLTAPLAPRPAIVVGGNALGHSHVRGHDSVRVLGPAGTAELAEVVLAAVQARDLGEGPARP